MVPVLLDEKVNCEHYGELLEDNCKGYRKLLREKSESYRDLLKGNCELLEKNFLKEVIYDFRQLFLIKWRMESRCYHFSQYLKRSFPGSSDLEILHWRICIRVELVTSNLTNYLAN
jgi:TorA maturation chaperone TorD